jgi:aspartate/methionine/tyrosine aminotransferase
VPPFVQRAGIAALTGPQHDVAAMVQEFRARRDLLVDALGTLPGVRCHEPRGAFYVFANVSEVPLPSDVLADRLLTEAGVAVLPGSAFGSPDSQYLRLSYANSRENIARAVARMAGFLARDA